MKKGTFFKVPFLLLVINTKSFKNIHFLFINRAIYR